MTSDELRDELRHPKSDPRRTHLRPEDEPVPEVPEEEDDERSMTADERRRKNPERLEHMPPATGPIAINEHGPKTED